MERLNSEVGRTCGLEEIYISNWKKTDNKTQFLETEKLENNNLDYVSLKKMWPVKNFTSRAQRKTACAAFHFISDFKTI